MAATEIEEILQDINVTKDKKNMRVIRELMEEDDLCAYSILADVAIERKNKLVASSAKSTVLDRAMGAMLGMAVGDSLGHAFEFLPAYDGPPKLNATQRERDLRVRGTSYFSLKDMSFSGESNVFNLERGQWTDDSAMGLCMADSLIVKQQFDGSDMRTRFWCWWYRGYNNAFRKDESRSSSVGLGGNISKSLDALYPGKTPPPRYENGTEDAGNGSLMRFAPIAIFLHAAPLATLYDVSRKSSYTTHPGIMAAEACTFLAHLIRRAFERPAGPVDAKQFLDESAEDYYKTSGLCDKHGFGFDEMRCLVKSTPVRKTEACWNWKSSKIDISGTLRARGQRYNGYPVSAGYFGSYCMDGLAMALWAVYNTTSFDEAIVKAINLLGDSDSHGSIAGQIAGALYGRSSIHPQFLAWVNVWDDNDFAVRALLLHHLGSNASAQSSNGSGRAVPSRDASTKRAKSTLRAKLQKRFARVVLSKRPAKKNVDRARVKRLRKPATVAMRRKRIAH